MRYVIICVDLQKDFWSVKGRCYTPKPCIQFIGYVFFPYLEERGIKIHEIISDYRPPRPGNRSDCCHPGEWGYESLVPDNLRASRWIKCMNSPVWTRMNIGEPDKTPGPPNAEPLQFAMWLAENVGRPEEVRPVLIGLTVDCCVLCTAQELNFLGYYPLVLREGVDHETGKRKDRDQILRTPMPNWAEVIDWKDLQPLL